VRKTHIVPSRPRLPPLRALVAFEAVVRLGSVTAAGEELGVTHGAVSKQLALLEDDLGQPLFRRARAGLLPTDAAEAFAREVRAALDRLEIGAAALRQRPDAGPLPSELRVIAPAAFALRWLLPRLHDLRDRAGLAAVLRTTDRDEDWRSTAFDVAIRRDQVPPPGLVAVEAMRESCTLVVARRGAARDPLPRWTFCEAETRPGELDAWLRLAGADPAACRDRRVFPRFYLALEAALAGAGALVAPLQLLAEELREGRLSLPFPRLVLPGAALACIFDPGGPRAAEARAFAAWLAEAAATPARPRRR
jgi:DNA-binding transcriptional LysR family regulator